MSQNISNRITSFHVCRFPYFLTSVMNFVLNTSQLNNSRTKLVATALQLTCPSSWVPHRVRKVLKLYIDGWSFSHVGQGLQFNLSWNSSNELFTRSPAWNLTGSFTHIITVRIHIRDFLEQKILDRSIDSYFIIIRISSIGHYDVHVFTGKVACRDSGRHFFFFASHYTEIRYQPRKRLSHIIINIFKRVIYVQTITDILEVVTCRAAEGLQRQS